MRKNFITATVIIILLIVAYVLFKVISIDNNWIAKDKVVNTDTIEQVQFSINESFTAKPEGKEILLAVNTIKAFSCSNYGLDHKVQISGSTINVDLGDIQKSEICLTSMGPAGFKEPIKLENRDYELVFKQGNGVDRYKVSVTENLITMTPVSETKFSTVSPATSERLPKEGLVFAECFYNGDSTFDPKDGFCSNFFVDIGKIAKPKYPADSGRELKRQFYNYEGSDEALSSIVKKYSRKDFYVHISTSSGKMYLCHEICEKPSVARFPKIQEVEYQK